MKARPSTAIPLENAAAQPPSPNLSALANLAAETYENLERSFREQTGALEQKASFLEAALELVSPGVCLFSRDERLIYCNRQYAEIYGIPPESLQSGMARRDILDLRATAGSAEAADNGSGAADAQPGATIAAADGQTMEIRYQPLAVGGWLEVHEPVAAAVKTKAGDGEAISLQAMIDVVPDYLWVKDADSRFRIANRAIAVDSGFSDVSEMIGLSDFDLHGPRLAQKFRKSEREIMAAGKPKIDSEEFVVDPNGNGRWFSSTKLPLFGENAECVGLVGISRDITARKKSEVLRAGQARIMEMIAMGAPLGDVLDNLMCLVESQLSGILGSVLLMDKDRVHLRHGAAPSLAEDYVNAIEGIAIGPDVGSCGTAAYSKQQVIVVDIMTDPRWADFRDLVEPYGYRSCWSTPVMSHGGAVLGVFAMYSMTVREPTPSEQSLIDFTVHIAGIAMERKLAADQISFMAKHDNLTGLPNRALLEERLTQAMLYAKRYQRRVSVAFVDLDKFKIINDTLGHNAGDELLKTVARRMSECLRATDTVIRLGGDEFVVILSDMPDSDEVATETLEKIRNAIGASVQIGDQQLTVTASMGAAHYPKDGETAETLLANADAAMYRAKELGRDNFQIYYPELNARLEDKLLLREGLRHALAENQLFIVYQPQLDLRSGKVTAVEALLRWNHPKVGLVMPAEFIDLAEESGQIIPIGGWVLHEACRQNKAWQDAGLPPVTVCVNVSPRQFQDRNLLSRVKSALSESGLEGKYLELEVTEGLVMQNIAHAVEIMNELQSLDVQISIDDFGTGYSSLAALKVFPVARLKIDKSFINDLAADENDQAVTSAVISLGRKLNLKVIAEGVETDGQVAFLRENDCDEIQGFHFSKPVDPGDIAAMLSGMIAAP